MLEKLPSERPNPASERIDVLEIEPLLAVIHAEDQKVPEAVGREIPRIARALAAIEERWRRGGRLLYVGAGTSGRLGALDAAEIPPTFGEEPNRVVAVLAGGPAAFARAVEGAEDSADAGAAAMAGLEISEVDAVVGIAASGRTPFVIGALREARRVGAATIALTTNPEAEMLVEADYPIVPLVGPEVVTGSTRMKSGTAQKLVLNMLSTGLMVRTGHTLGNRMVNVRPTNEKLRERARRLVEEIGGCTEEQARLAMAAAGDVRAAVVMVRLGLELEQARARLAASGGVLRAALEDGETR